MKRDFIVALGLGLAITLAARPALAIASARTATSSYPGTPPISTDAIPTRTAPPPHTHDIYSTPVASPHTRAAHWTAAPPSHTRDILARTVPCPHTCDILARTVPCPHTRDIYSTPVASPHTRAAHWTASPPPHTHDIDSAPTPSPHNRDILARLEFQRRAGLPNLFGKIRTRRQIRIAYLGGSITGAKEGWRDMTFDWFRLNYPDNAFYQIDASVGGTGSLLGVFRIDSILAQRPDLLFVEFAVNDENDMSIGRRTAAMEGIVRKTWSSLPGTDIIFVYTTARRFCDTLLATGRRMDAVTDHEKVAAHYDIPSIDLSLEILRQAQTGKLVLSGEPSENAKHIVFWGKGDDYHPLQESGHALYAATIVRHLKEMGTGSTRKFTGPLGSTTSRNLASPSAPHVLPTPLLPDSWQASQMVYPSDATLSGSWTALTPADQAALAGPTPRLWRAAPGASLKFSFEGTELGLYDLIGPGSGSLSLTIDGRPQQIQRFNHNSWFWHRHNVFLDKLPSGVHEVEIKVNTTSFDKSAVIRPGEDRVKYANYDWYPGAILIVGRLLPPAIARHSITLDYLDLNKLTQQTGRPQVTGEKAGLVIHGRKFQNGFHTQAESRLYIALDGRAAKFTAEVGVDDRTTPFRVDPVNKESSSAEFFVIGDGKTLWHSGEMKFGANSRPLQVDLAGVKSLLLKVTGKPGNTHADWVNTLITYNGQMPYSVWSPEDSANIRENLAWIEQQRELHPEPRINGAMVTGIRPSTPFYYPIAATGARPLQYEATGLPVGLSLDAGTGIITGQVRDTGTFKVQLKVTNSAGVAQRTLRIIVGDKLALTPPMGYLSWNVVEGLISDTYMRELTDAMVSFGLRDVGYQYVNMDDCWQGGRDSSGHIYPDKIRFPYGLEPVGDYLHRQGMKLGIYTSPGPVTCAGYQGTLNYERQDVESWLRWGVDYLKYDGCSVPQDRSGDLYALMGRLLREAPRSIVYCGRREAGSQLWRIGGDLRDQWNIESRDVGVIQSFEKAQKNAGMQSPGGWVDPDMLVVGIHGHGGSGNDKTNALGCTDLEYRSHMSLWALISAPLFVTADVRHIDRACLETLTNPEVIEVNQDPLGSFPVRVGAGSTGAGGAGITSQQEIWVKDMEDGSKVAALFNRSGSEASMTLNLPSLKGVLRDLWLRKDIGTFKGSYSTMVPGHGVTLLRVTPK